MGRPTKAWLVAVLVFGVIVVVKSSLYRARIVRVGDIDPEHPRSRFRVRPGSFPDSAQTKPSSRETNDGSDDGVAISNNDEGGGGGDVGAEPDNSHLIASDSARTGAAAGSSPFYSLAEDVMSQEFREHLDYIVKKINSRWTKSAWRKYDREDISDCATSTPECGLFLKLPNGDGRPYRKCCVEHRRLKDTAKWVAQQLDAHNVTYFLSTGSALGSVRHGGTIIPWDTDVDIAIFPQDEAKVGEIFRGNAHHHFNKDPLGKPMYWIHASADGKPADGPHVEVFFDPVYTAYPASLLPLEPCKFYDVQLNCPKRAMLDVWFPSGWSRYGGCHYHGKDRGTIYSKGRRKATSKC